MFVQTIIFVNGSLVETSFYYTMKIVLMTIILLCYLNLQFEMFKGAAAFNQDIGNWDVSKVNWFVSVVMNTNKANTNVAKYKLTYLTHNLLLPFLLIFMYRMTCF